MSTNPKDGNAEISIDRFKELSDGDTAGLRELITLYLTKTDEQMRELAKALQEKNGTEAARISHSMVGANAMVGLDAVVPGLRKVEELADTNQLSEARTIFDGVNAELKRIQAFLKKYSETLG